MSEIRSRAYSPIDTGNSRVTPARAEESLQEEGRPNAFLADLRALQTSQHTGRIEPNFNWSVWFLELNNKTLASCLVLRYKKVASITKGSYNEQYKRFYPGIYQKFRHPWIVQQRRG